jgi:hypothetical protein
MVLGLLERQEQIGANDVASILGWKVANYYIEKTLH